jgi:hypothetical protein
MHFLSMQFSPPSCCSHYLRLYSVEWKNVWSMMKLKGCERKRSWPNSRYYPDISLDEAEKNSGKSHDIRCLGRDVNSKPREHELEALPLEGIRFASFSLHRNILKSKLKI